MYYRVGVTDDSQYDESDVNDEAAAAAADDDTHISFFISSTRYSTPGDIVCGHNR